MMLMTLIAGSVLGAIIGTMSVLFGAVGVLGGIAIYLAVALMCTMLGISAEVGRANALSAPSRGRTQAV